MTDEVGNGVSFETEIEGLNVEGRMVGRRGEKDVNVLQMLVGCLDGREEGYLEDSALRVGFWSAREVIKGFESELKPLEQRRHSISNNWCWQTFGGCQRLVV